MEEDRNFSGNLSKKKFINFKGDWRGVELKSGGENTKSTTSNSSSVRNLLKPIDEVLGSAISPPLTEEFDAKKTIVLVFRK